MKLKYISGVLLLAAGLAFNTSCNDEEDYPIGKDVVKSVTTGDAAFTAISAEITGTVSGLETLSSSAYEVGAMYSTASDPTQGGTKVKGTYNDGQIVASLSGLTPGTTYYYCTYVLLQGKVYQYGEVRSFVATNADIATAGVIKLTSTTAMIQGQYNGTENISNVTVGIKVAESTDELQDGTAFVADSIGSYQYNSTLYNLLPSTTYYAIAYFDLNGTVKYGEPVEFQTPDQTVEYVDLGLSVCWASANLGAEQPSVEGAKMNFEDLQSTMERVKLDADGNYISALPTKAEVDELIKGTTQTQETVDGVEGIRFTGSNGNSIFLPAGNYWSGETVKSNSSYGVTLNASGSTAKRNSSAVETILAARTVAQEVVTEGIRIYRSKIVQGDIEGNGNYRVEIYNTWGATADAPAVNLDDIKFDTNMKLTFTITGINDGQTHTACFAYADPTWACQNWSYNDSGEASVAFNKDGTYSMILHNTTGSTVSSAAVYCVDFAGLSSACGADNINVRIESIVMDAVEEPGVIKVNNAKLVTGDIENNGNYRIELYNEYGASKADPAVNPADIKFDYNMQLKFKLTGITSENEYKCHFTFADGDWSPSNWGYNESGEASCIVKGDGEYTLTLHGAGEGAMVFCVDVEGLSADCGAENIQAEVTKLVMDHAGTSVKENADGYLNVGDLEDNGRIRIEIYNEYGGTKEHSIIDPNSIVFSENMAVTFNITGIDGNLKEGAAGSYVAGLEYSDPTWGVSYWSALEQTQYEAPITCDGTYTVWCEVDKQANGAVVFCIDIKDLDYDLVDNSKIAAEIVDIKLDATLDQKINPAINKFQNKDGNGIDGRIEIYNEYGEGGTNANGYYNDNLAFNGMCLVQFTISGIDGNLVSGAAGSYTATMSYADQDWSPSYWGGNSYGNATVTGDGTYQVYAYLNGDCYGAVVWTVELYGLWKDLVNTENVQVSIDKIITPRKL